jgi:glycosyltransferase involved in cell wall biosynthesis
MKLISIIAPCFNEELNIEPFYGEIVSVFSSLPGYEFQLIFADDCSTDSTVEIVKKIISLDPRVEMVINHRNFGVYRNSFNALKYARGIATIPMLPVDMQDPPSLIPKMLSEFEKGFAVVAGVKYERNEKFLMKKLRHAYYAIVGKLANFQLPENVGEFQIIDSELVKKLVSIDDYYPYTRGLIASLSSDRSYVHYEWQARKFGKTKHNMAKLIDQGINGAISTSNAPLRALSILSSISAVIGIFFGLFQVVAFFTFSSKTIAPGVSTIIILISFLTLYISIALGVIAEYVAAIHAQVRGRSRVFEREHISSNE